MICRSTVVNRGRTPVRIKEVVLLGRDLELPPETRLYGEGFQMLSQTGGTLGAPFDLSQYTDANHYKMVSAPGSRAYYGLVSLTSPDGDTQLFAFTSCAKYSGRFEIRGSSIQVVVDTEGLELAPAETWALDELFVGRSRNGAKLLEDVAARLAIHHPRPITG